MKRYSFFFATINIRSKVVCLFILATCKNSTLFALFLINNIENSFCFLIEARSNQIASSLAIWVILEERENERENERERERAYHYIIILI